MVADNIVMTNRHVAQFFSTGLGRRHLYLHDEAPTKVDFRRERDRTASEPAEVRRVLMVHPYWDMALLELDRTDRPALPLNAADPRELAHDELVVVGFPGFDRTQPFDLQADIFGGVYSVKRVLPGYAKADRHPVEGVLAMGHDASTLGGSSGSAVINVRTAQVVGLHFGGWFEIKNHAVPMHDLAQDPFVRDVLAFKNPPPGATEPPWLARWRPYEAPTTPESPVGETDADVTFVSVSSNESLEAARPSLKATVATSGQTKTVRVQIPLEITVAIGDAVVDAPGQAEE